MTPKESTMKLLVALNHARMALSSMTEAYIHERIRELADAMLTWGEEHPLDVAEKPPSPPAGYERWGPPIDPASGSGAGLYYTPPEIASEAARDPERFDEGARGDQT